MNWELRGTAKCLSVFLLICTACKSAENLTPLPEVKVTTVQSNEVNFNFCTDPAYTPKQYVKMIVVLDHSGSNSDNYKFDANGDGGPFIPFTDNNSFATDITGISRYGGVGIQGTLLNYLQNVPANDPADPTHFFALVDFGDNTAPYPAAGFSSDTVDFFNYVQADVGGLAGGLAGHAGAQDTGGTNYPGVLKQVSSLIITDINNAQACAKASVVSPTCPNPGVATQSAYVVVFMSDGAPIQQIVLNSPTDVEIDYYDGFDNNNNPTTTQDFQTAEVAILGQVQTLVQAASSQTVSNVVAGINFFTIYYYSNNQIDANTGKLVVDLRAQKLLADMATAGNGRSYIVQGGTTDINYNAFQPAGKIVKPKLGDVFVTNATATWWNDGTLHADTDMDGLPDDVEQTFCGSVTAFCKGNGVSNLVNYINQNGVAGAGTNFSAGGKPCNGIPRPGGIYRTTGGVPAGLNDCEKAVLGDSAGLDMPDSNGDLVPDWLEFINQVSFQVGTPSAGNSPVQDGYTLYQKIKYSLPINYPAQEILELHPSTYTLSQVSSTPTKDCYTLTVDNLPYIDNINNMVRIDVMEIDPLTSANNMYKVGVKAFPNRSVTFGDWNDPAEITAGTWSTWP